MVLSVGEAYMYFIWTSHYISLINNPLRICVLTECPANENDRQALSVSVNGGCFPPPTGV